MMFKMFVAVAKTEPVECQIYQVGWRCGEQGKRTVICKQIKKTSRADAFLKV